MAARTTRRISQPNSRYRAHIKAALRHSSENNIAQRCYRLRSSPAQALPRDFIRGQNPKGRSVPDRTACRVLPATNCFTRQLSLAGISLRTSEVNLRFRD